MPPILRDGLLWLPEEERCRRDPIHRRIGRREKGQNSGGERIPENGVHTGYRVAYRHGIPCVAVIPRPYGDEIAFRGLSAGVPILYSHFHGDFDRYGTRIAIKNVLHGRGYDLQKQFPEVDRRLVGEPTEHDVRHFFQLLFRRLVECGVVVSVYGPPTMTTCRR